MKMYILIKEDIPLGHAMTAAAHASIAAYLRFKDTDEVQEWLSGPFRKVICKVNDQEFNKAKDISDNVTLTESALDNAEVALAYKPKLEWPKNFKYYRLYK